MQTVDLWMTSATTESSNALTPTTGPERPAAATNSLDLDLNGNGMGQPGSSVLTAVIAIMAVIIAFGSVGNLFVIVAVLFQKKLRTTSNMFVVNLSACDFLFVTSVLPFNVYTYLTNDWHMHEAICSFVGFLSYTFTGTTILTITFIAWNRYKLVVDMASYKKLFSNRNLAIMMASTWVIPAVSLQIAVFKQWGSFGYVPLLSSCNLTLDNASQSFKVFLLVIRAAIPSGLIIYFYVAIYVTTHDSHQRLRHVSSAMHQNNVRHEMRLTRMMAGIFAVFAVSYFPCTVSSVIDWNHLLNKTYHLFCQTSVFLGSAINPLLYGFMNEGFRKAYIDIVTCSLFMKRGGHRLMREPLAATTGSPTQTPSTNHKPLSLNGKYLPHSLKSQDITPSMDSSRQNIIQADEMSHERI